MASLFFDLDGTLTDPRAGITRCLRHALKGLGVAVPGDDELARYIGPPLADTFRSLLGPGAEARVPEAIRVYRERFASVGIYENAVYPGVPGALEALALGGYSLFVVTSKPTPYAVRIVDHFGLSNSFAGVYGSELSGERVNKAELIRHVLQIETLHPDEVTMIGDRSHDVAGARANGVRALGVLWGYGDHAELLAAGAAGAYASLPELVSDLLPARASLTRR